MISLIILSIKYFVNGFIEYLKEFHRKDKENKYTLQDDVQTFKTKYDSSFSKFYANEKKKSKLFDCYSRKCHCNLIFRTDHKIKLKK